MPRKIAFLGGGGVRTPLVVFGINESVQTLDAEELMLYDVDQHRAEMIARLGREVVRRESGSLKISVAKSPEEAVDGASFVLNSVRVGGIGTRAHDERAAMQCGYPGQETTGPGGVAMGQRTIPVAIEQAKLVERLAPSAWIINFTNPAGLITQAIAHHSGAKVIGICDTPTELLHRIQTALQAPAKDVVCEYVGLNHLGWVRRVTLRGEDVTSGILQDDAILSQLYSAPLFDHELIRAIGLIPTEYLFFYYSRRRALENQRKQGATRGEQIAAMNESLMQRLMELLTWGEDAAALRAEVLIDWSAGAAIAASATHPPASASRSSSTGQRVPARAATRTGSAHRARREGSCRASRGSARSDGTRCVPTRRTHAARRAAEAGAPCASGRIECQDLPATRDAPQRNVRQHSGPDPR